MADKPKVAESGVLRACLDLLAAERIWAIRMNTGAVKDGKRFFRFGRKGMADILALPGAMHHCLDHGREYVSKVLWIETKSSTGQQTAAQKEFQQEVEAHGHQYILVRDVSELQDWLRKNR